MNHIQILSLLLLFLHYSRGQRGLYFGCYRPRNTNIQRKIEKYGAADSADNCISECASFFYRFAGIKKGEICWCVNILDDSIESELCDIQCRGNVSQLCGGNDETVNSIYDTGIKVPGPPQNVEIKDIKETTLEIQWKPAEAWPDITDYVVKASVVHTYASYMLPTPQWKVYNGTCRISIANLHPGTQYNMTIEAQFHNDNGYPASILVTTLIGEPNPIPEMPVVVKRDKNQMVIQIQPAVNDNGPITAYRIIVINEDLHQAFLPELLKPYTEANNEGLPYYVAAEISPLGIKNNFVVGDGQRYNQFYNAPLLEDVDYHITIGIVSRKDNLTKIRYSESDHSQHGIVVLRVNDENEESNAVVIFGLSIAIGLFSFLLLLSILMFFVLRYRIQNRRRRIPDCQELSLQGPILEMENNGYIPEEEIEKVNHYENLKEKVWSVPKNFLDVKYKDIFGYGKFGQIVQGNVLQQGIVKPVCVYVIPDDSLQRSDEKAMLYELNSLIIVGKHQNLICLIGIYENPDTLHIVLEHYPQNLKELLLNNRKPDSEQNKFTSLSEKFILNVMLQIASAMDYLASKKIVHKRLCAKNIVMTNENIPKVSGYALLDYNKDMRMQSDQSYIRWTAHEVFRQKQHSTKSDIWSYGCLLWEVTCLGGTPYANIPTSEVGSKIVQGVKLPQLPYVADDLYQLMINCWQFELDERPTFQELIQGIEYILGDLSTVPLNFSLYSGFVYEQYRAVLE